MAVPVMKGRAAENESERGALVIRASLSSDILLRPDRPLPPSLLTTQTGGKREGRPSNALKLLLSYVLISLRCWELSLLPPRCVLFNEGRGRRGECGAQGLGMLLTLPESPVRVCLSTSASAQPWCMYMNVYVW